MGVREPLDIVPVVMTAKRPVVVQYTVTRFEMDRYDSRWTVTFGDGPIQHSRPLFIIPCDTPSSSCLIVILASSCTCLILLEYTYRLLHVDRFLHDHPNFLHDRTRLPALYAGLSVRPSGLPAQSYVYTVGCTSSPACGQEQSDAMDSREQI